VLQAAAANVYPPLPLDKVRDDVYAAPSSDTNRITVSAVGSTPEQARSLVNAVVAQYRVQAAARVAATLGSALASVDDNALRQDIELRAAAYGDGVAAVEPGELPKAASAPLPTQNALLGGLVALLLAAGVAVLRDQRRAQWVSIADLDLLLGAPLLSRFPVPASTRTADMVTADPMSPRLRAAHDTMLAVDVALEGASPASVLFLSWQRARTTTSLVATVAAAAARDRRSVVVIDGGLKVPSVTTMSDVEPGHGLDALLNLDVPVSASLRTWTLDGLRIGVVPVNELSPSPTGAVARPQVLTTAVDRLRETTGLILVDGPPLTERSLGLALGRGVDGIVMVIDERTTVDDAHEMGRRIALAGVRVLGYVLVGVPHRRHAARNRTLMARTEKPASTSTSS
jgi:Mrp family chromosome partitioning ATPase